MATYNFSALVNNQSLAFNPAVDTLAFNIAGLDAASGGFAQSGADLLITYAGKTVKLTGMTLDPVSSAHFTFANGSKLLIGDNTPGAANDGAANTLTGTAFGDYLDGRGGADRLYGGPGNDTYVVDNAGDVVQDYITGVGGGGIDTVRSYLANYTLPYYGGGDFGIEILRLMGTGNLNGAGNAGDNTLYANAGNNVLNGGGGNDTLSYLYTSAAVAVSLAKTTAQATGGSGTDTLRHFENLTGGAFNDSLTGNAGNNALDGGTGADTLTGGDGNDSYAVDNAGDKVVETNASATQIDTAQSYLASYILPANVENLRLMGGGNLNGTGNGLRNVIYANAGNNLLDGGAGTDTASYAFAAAGVAASLAVATAQVTGGSGSDTLVNFENLEGGAFADKLSGNSLANVLSGGGGADTLSGGDGNDRLVVADLGFAKVDGGAGSDTLALGGTGLYLDLAVLGGKLNGLEGIDLVGANTLVLSPATVKNLSPTSDTLVVDGGAQSLLSGGGGWTQGANAIANSQTYRTYTQGGATVWVNAAVGVNNMNVVMPPSFALSGLNGSNGFRLDGAAFDYAGVSVGAAGDVNGDGYGDLVVASAYNGMSYLLFGKAGGFTAPVDLSALNGGNGFQMYGAEFSVDGAGDVNGDGYADLVLGNDTGGTPTAYVVFGGGNGFASLVDLAGLNGANGFRLSDPGAYDESPLEVSAAGDINGDGYADIIVGEPDASPLGRDYAGSSFVVFGKASGFAAGFNLSTLNGGNGFRIDGAAGQHSGVVVNSAGDINGDGYADLIIDTTRPYGDPAQAKQGYVVFGKSSGFAPTLDLSALNGGNGFLLTDAEGGYTGSVDSAGDVNGDGCDDLIIGSGAHAAVVFGKATGFSASLDLSALNGGNGFLITGAGGATGYGAITSVGSAGDVNGDGYDDLIVGANRSDPPSHGYQASGYVIYGKSSGFPASLDIANLNGGNGFRLDGANQSVNSAGDVNGDGFGDLVVGNASASPNGKAHAGSSYVLFGGNFTGAVAKLGTSGNDTLTGTTAGERFVGGRGNDTLIGGGGADFCYGGQGDDAIKLADLGFRKVDGGSGMDTLFLTGAGLNLNLAGFHNRISGIEKIDLTGGGDNTLSFLKREVLNLSDTRNTLQVDGNAGDHYHFSDGGWVQGADVTLVGVAYHVFDNGAAHLLLDAALTAI